MSTFKGKSRNSDILSAKVDGKERTAKVEQYCRVTNTNYKTFFNQLVDAFFENEENYLKLLSKEQLIDMIIKKGDVQYGIPENK